MKTFLMHPGRDFDTAPPSKQGPIQFAQDIELPGPLNAAAAGDRYLRDLRFDAAAGGTRGEARNWSR